MKNLMAYIGLMLVITINSGCPKPCVEANYSFAVNSQITPDIDSVHVGDSIFLNSSFTVKLTDQITGMVVDYSNSSDIGSTLGIVKLIDGIYPGIDAVDEFNYSSIIGDIFNDNSIPSPNKVQQLKYKEVNDHYQIKIAIIPKQKGIYYFGIGNGLSNGRGNSKTCEKAGFIITFTNTNQHFNYFNDWNASGTLSPIEKPRAYFIKVY